MPARLDYLVPRGDDSDFAYIALHAFFWLHLCLRERERARARERENLSPPSNASQAGSWWYFSFSGFLIHSLPSKQTFRGSAAAAKTFSATYAGPLRLIHICSTYCAPPSSPRHAQPRRVRPGMQAPLPGLLIPSGFLR